MTPLYHSICEQQNDTAGNPKYKTNSGVMYETVKDLVGLRWGTTDSWRACKKALYAIHNKMKSPMMLSIGYCVKAAEREGMTTAEKLRLIKVGHKRSQPFDVPSLFKSFRTKHIRDGSLGWLRNIQ